MKNKSRPSTARLSPLCLRSNVGAPRPDPQSLHASHPSSWTPAPHPSLRYGASQQLPTNRLWLMKCFRTACPSVPPSAPHRLYPLAFQARTRNSYGASGFRRATVRAVRSLFLRMHGAKHSASRTDHRHVLGLCVCVKDTAASRRASHTQAEGTVHWATAAGGRARHPCDTPRNAQSTDVQILALCRLQQRTLRHACMFRPRGRRISFCAPSPGRCGGEQGRVLAVHHPRSYNLS